MIVPRFRIVQTDEHLIIIVKVPYVKISNAEVYVEKFKFTFFLKPYLLNLNFKNELREEDPSSAVYDHNTYETTFKLRKKNVGEYFEDTDMINSLLNKKKDKGEKKKTFKIEVLGGQDFNTEEGKTEEVKEDKVSELNKEPHEVYSYGFNRGFTHFFDHLEEELLELCELDPDRSNLLERRELKLISEEQKFDVDHYLADKFENPEIERIAKEKLRIYGGTLRAQNENEFVEAKDQSKFEEEEWNIINKLPRKEYLEEGSEALLLQLVDILFAFLYEYRSMEGDFTSESGWTINKLSATLSCFTEETDVRSVIISSMRRSLIYPLYRSTELSYKILEDLVQYLRAGKLPLLKIFLKIKSIFERSEPRYLLNTLYIDDFCLYLQTVDQKKYEDLANQIAALKIEKKDISLDLEELEKEALEIIEDEKNNPRGEEDEEEEEEETPVKKDEAPQEKKKGLIEVVGETRNDDGESEGELEKLE